MTYRKLVFADGEYYHIFNRGIARAPIFKFSKDYLRFLNLLNYYLYNPKLSYSHYSRLDQKTKAQLLSNLQKSDPTVDILAFCLMENHFHLLVKQNQENGIKTLLSTIQNSYAKYFNKRHNRSGSLFQSMFKAVRIEDDEQLLHVSRYIHLNPVTAYIVEAKNILSYRWSSLTNYIDEAIFPFIKNGVVLGLIGKNKYKDFVLDQINYQRELDKIKHLCLE